jgi:EmrB/QacA subfamily drug resistance transporter
MLVAMRALQALGAALLFASSPAILTTSFPPTQRGRALGIQAMMTYLGLSVGPPLGGWLAGAFGWPAVFYINLPVGALAIGLALRFVADDRPARAAERFDWTGALLFSTGLVLLLLALNQGHAWGWLAAPTLGLLAAAAAALGLFVRVEAASRSPMLDLTLFRSGTFSSATASALLSYVCSYAVIFVLPFLLVQGRGLSTARAGVVLAAEPVVMAVVAPISGILSDRIGSRLLTSAGMMVLGAGLALLALLSAAGTPAALAGGLAIVGLGFGLFSSPNNSALMGAAPRHRQGIASGVLATARNVGMVLGVGLTGAILTTFLARGPSGLVGGVRASLLVSAGVAVVAGVVSLKR